MAVDAYHLAMGGAVCLALGILLSRYPHPREEFDRWLRFLAPVLLLATFIAAWAAFRLVPHWNWSAARLAASVRIVHGFQLYSGPNDAAVNGWIYGPVSAIAYAPAAFGGEPLTALRLAAALNAAYFFLPIIALLCPYLRRCDSLAAGAIIVAFAVNVMLVPFGLWYGAAALNSDVVATSLGILSCVAITSQRLPLASLLCVAAAWSKQTDAVLAIAQLLYLLRVHGARTALRYVGWLVLAALLSLATFSAWFGAERLWHCLIVIPSAHAIESGRIPVMLAAFAWATWWVWLLAGLVRPWRTASEDPLSGGLATLLLLAAIIILPAGVLAAAKTGGDQNSLHAMAYAILAGTLLAIDMLRRKRVHQCVARVTLLGGALLAAAFNLHRVLANEHLGVREPGMQHREAFEFAKSRPGEVYFPCNTLITLLSERRDYPFDYGLYDWRIAGRSVEPVALRQLLPSTLQFLVYHEKDPSHEVRLMLPEFSNLRQTNSWDIYTR